MNLLSIQVPDDDCAVSARICGDKPAFVVANCKTANAISLFELILRYN